MGPATTTAVDLRSAVDRYFELSLFLLLACGFAMLVGTGTLDAGSIVLVAAGLLLRGTMLLRGRSLVLPERASAWLTLAFVAFYGVDWLMLSRSFVTATVHLVLFSTLAKMFTVHRERDHIYLAVLAFLMVLAAAVLTVDTLFLVLLALFVLLAIATFSSHEVRRSLRANAARVAPVASPARLQRSLSHVALAALGAVLLAAGVLFFVLPRASGGYLNQFAPQDRLISGFSEEVRFGSIGRIQQSDQLVMHVQFDPGSAVPPDVKWRGITLSLFDGQRWSNPPEESEELRRLPGLGFVLPRPTGASGSPVLSYRVFMEPGTAQVFFLIPNATNVDAGFDRAALRPGEALEPVRPLRPIGSYAAVSVPPRMTDAMRRAGSEEIPPDLQLRYLEVPRLDPRVAAAAAEVTRTARTPYAKAVLLERWLRSPRFGYTLDLPNPVPRDPIAYFLFERRKGHCEFFASSMAVMLRTLGIPSRIANGFRGGEYNDISGTYVVRARDAHSWVEAWFPGAGWIAFDPTPGTGVESPTGWSRALLYMDAMRTFWREWVVDYDFSRQEMLRGRIGSGGRALAQGGIQQLRRRYEALLNRLRRTVGGLRTDAMRNRASAWLLGILLAALAALSIVAVRPLRRHLHRRWLLRHPASEPRHAAALWYGRVLRLLRSQGVERPPSQTAVGLAVAVPSPTLRGAVESFARAYEAARFGASEPDAEKLPELYEAVAAAARTTGSKAGR